MENATSPETVVALIGVIVVLVKLLELVITKALPLLIKKKNGNGDGGKKLNDDIEHVRRKTVSIENRAEVLEAELKKLIAMLEETDIDGIKKIHIPRGWRVVFDNVLELVKESALVHKHQLTILERVEDCTNQIKATIGAAPKKRGS